MESQLKSQEFQEVSLFVENLSKGVRWKGLWHLFARHGDVTEAFVAGKLSRGGKRFGFVRFRCKTDAMRTMERLNGFSVYGFRLTVKLANPKKRKQFLNQTGINRGKSAAISTPRQSKQEQVHSKEPVDSSSQANVVLKKIVGHVEDEEMFSGRNS
ncbi:hypothetical protein V6N13_013188 [Hibiscus sabdariffa]|uniref:RRM domain-containing protein n=1 Tax=Hibiscus sabdariffa TaxID=183260 RepID=A0ABR2SHX7_9ROSI